MNVGYDELEFALEESIKLQSHYAYLLNMYDGGNRTLFKNSREWLERLRKLENKDVKSGTDPSRT